CVIIRRLKYPNPDCAPSHSPIAAPITLKGMATFKPEKKCGNAEGICNLKNISFWLAPIVKRSYSICLLLERKPSIVLTVIGKNVIKVVRSEEHTSAIQSRVDLVCR